MPKKAEMPFFSVKAVAAAVGLAIILILIWPKLSTAKDTLFDLLGIGEKCEATGKTINYYKQNVERLQNEKPKQGIKTIYEELALNCEEFKRCFPEEYRSHKNLCCLKEAEYEELMKWKHEVPEKVFDIGNKFIECYPEKKPELKRIYLDLYRNEVFYYAKNEYYEFLKREFPETSGEVKNSYLSNMAPRLIRDFRYSIRNHINGDKIPMTIDIAKPYGDFFYNAYQELTNIQNLDEGTIQTIKDLVPYAIYFSVYEEKYGSLSRKAFTFIKHEKLVPSLIQQDFTHLFQKLGTFKLMSIVKKEYDIVREHQNKMNCYDSILNVLVRIEEIEKDKTKTYPSIEEIQNECKSIPNIKLIASQQCSSISNQEKLPDLLKRLGNCWLAERLNEIRTDRLELKTVISRIKNNAP